MKPDFLTPAMRSFVDMQVREGRALTPDEYIRFIVGAEIKRWERVNRRAFEAPRR